MSERAPWLHYWTELTGGENVKGVEAKKKRNFAFYRLDGSVFLREGDIDLPQSKRAVNIYHASACAEALPRKGNFRLLPQNTKSGWLNAVVFYLSCPERWEVSP